MVKIKKNRLFLAVLAAMACLLLPEKTRAQDWAFAWTLFDQPTALPAVVLRQRCFAGLSSECSEAGGPDSKQSCRLREERVLGQADGHEIVLLRFRHDWLFSDGMNAEGCQAEDVVIAERDPASSMMTPVFGDATDPDFAFVGDARLINHAKGPFLALNYCANGTGGCDTLAFVRRDGRWLRLEKDASWANAGASIPKGYAPHKSPAIDFERLSWEQHLATIDDPNCCPSGRMLYDLDIVNDKLSVRSFRVETGVAVP